VIAAVVVRWRGGAEVHRCLASLLAHGGPCLGEIVLVDSGSDDGGAERLASDFPEVRVLGLASNRGFAWAANHGVAATGGSEILLLNPDTEVHHGQLETLARALDERRESAGVVPLLVGSDGRPQDRWQLRRLPGRLRLAAGLPGAPAFPDGPPGSPAPVKQPAAACWLVRRSSWNRLGGLDPIFAPAWWEDVDFCARLAADPAADGFTVIPEVRILHHGGSSVGALGETPFLLAFNRNLLLYARRHHRRAAPWIAAGLRLGLLARALGRPSQRRAYLATLSGLGQQKAPARGGTPTRP
jgi:GT2 family glycosyltransferase